MFNGGIVLAATAVRATVAEALRIGKTACHGDHFTAIGGPSVNPTPHVYDVLSNANVANFETTTWQAIGRQLPYRALVRVQSGG
jgi:hypothetical protein